MRGIKIYNDTTATTPEATVAALRALQPTTYNLKPKIILIMGGSDKGLDMSGLVKEIPKYCKVAIFLSGTGTEKFKTKNLKLKIITEYDNLKPAVKKPLVWQKEKILFFSAPPSLLSECLKMNTTEGTNLIK